MYSQADPDILVVTETWLKKSINNSDVSINGYNIYRIDRTGRGGGVTIYVKNCPNVSILYAIIVPKCFEFTALKIECESNNSIVVVGIYWPSSANSCSVAKLENLLSQYVNSEMIIPGD